MSRYKTKKSIWYKLRVRIFGKSETEKMYDEVNLLLDHENLLKSIEDIFMKMMIFFLYLTHHLKVDVS